MGSRFRIPFSQNDKRRVHPRRVATAPASSLKGMALKREFKAKLVARGPKGAWTFLPIPFDVETAFGSRARVPVSGTINGFSFRNSLMPVGDGTHLLTVSKELQAGAKAGAGDMVRVTLERDDAERTVEVPRELADGLARNKRAAAVFKKLTYSQKKEYATWIASAKLPATKASRVAKAVGLLAAGQKRLS
jgi:hypothetical protein